MRFSEFNKRSDEAIPALGKMAKGLGAVAGAVKQAGGVGAAVKQAGGIKGAMKAAGQVAGAAMGKPAAGAQSVAQKQAQKAQQQLQKQLMKKGSKIPFPTQSGKAKEFEIDNVQGDEVTLVNPDARQKPEEPEKLIYKKKDVDTVVQSLGQQQ